VNIVLYYNLNGATQLDFTVSPASTLLLHKLLNHPNLKFSLPHSLTHWSFASLEVKKQHSYHFMKILQWDMFQWVCSLYAPYLQYLCFIQLNHIKALILHINISISSVIIKMLFKHFLYCKPQILHNRLTKLVVEHPYTMHLNHLSVSQSLKAFQIILKVLLSISKLSRWQDSIVRLILGWYFWSQKCKTFVISKYTSILKN